MYHMSAQGVDERMVNVHYYYYIGSLSLSNVGWAVYSACSGTTEQ